MRASEDFPVYGRHSRCSGLRSDHSGFTAFELTLALLCVAILAAIAVPNFQRLQQEWTLWGGARVLESSLRWGRMYAISANASLSLEVNGDGSGFHWTDPETGDPYKGTLRYLPGGIRITGAPRRPLRFYQHGNAVPAGTFVLQGAAGTYRVIVNPAGRIRMQRGR